MKITTEECVKRIISKAKYILGPVGQAVEVLDPSQWKRTAKTGNDATGYVRRFLYGTPSIKNWRAEVHSSTATITKILIWTPDGTEILSKEERAAGREPVSPPGENAPGIRFHELAKEMGIPTKTLIEKAVELGFKVKSHASLMTHGQADRLRAKFGGKNL